MQAIDVDMNANISITIHTVIARQWKKVYIIFNT